MSEELDQSKSILKRIKANELPAPNKEQSITIIGKLVEVTEKYETLQAENAALKKENSKLNEAVGGFKRDLVEKLDQQRTKNARLTKEVAALKEQLAEAQNDAEQQSADFNAAITHAISQGLEAADFLRYWQEGDWDACSEFGFEVSENLRHPYNKAREAGK